MGLYKSSKSFHEVFKIEDLKWSIEYADRVSEVLYDFLTDDIGYYTKEWISPIECRRRDGFIPYSNNKGGYQAYTYKSILDAYFEPTGFEKFDKVCENDYNYNLKYFLEKNKIPLEDYNKGIDDDNADMLELREDFEGSFCSDYDSTCFETMLKIEDDNTLFISFMLKASDAPYFRSYDDCIDFEIKFNNIFELKNELNKILDNDRVQDFISIINY